MSENSSFDTDQFDAIYPVGIERHYWTLARNKILFHFLSKNGLSSARILEIGCGKGIVVDYLRERGLDCYGVEVASVIPLTRVQSFVTCGTDYSVLPQDFAQSIQTVLLFDVIEHIEGPVSFIISIRKKFPNLKHIVVTVPARQELWSNYDVFNGHYRRYSITDLKKLSQSTQFPLLSDSYFFHSLYVPARILLWLTGKRSTRILPPHGASISFHRVLAGYFFLDFLFLPSSAFGTSIIASFSTEKLL